MGKRRRRRRRARGDDPRGVLLRAGLVVLGALAALNLAVAEVGESHTFLLSPRFVAEKAQALQRFAAHRARHPEACGGHKVSAAQVRQVARRHGLPPEFLLKLARTESALKPHRISPAGAMGVMQLMPGTARELEVVDPFHPGQSLDGGARYLKRLWRRYGGNRCRVAAAYNAGPGRVPKRGALRLPAETRGYVRKILGAKALDRC